LSPKGSRRLHSGSRSSHLGEMATVGPLGRRSQTEWDRGQRTPGPR
jgi:hypothetical protein